MACEIWQRIMDGINMRCCCFCGKRIEELPSYVLLLRKQQSEEGTEMTTQELYCHEKCLEDSLYQKEWFYLKYV